MTTIYIGAATVRVSPGRVETWFGDGTCCAAEPEDTEEYRETARRLGYGEDTARLSRDHEIIHSALAEARGLDVSPVLWAVAHGDHAGTPERWAEEAEVIAAQAFFMGVGPEPPGALPWEALRGWLDWDPETSSR